MTFKIWIKDALLLCQKEHGGILVELKIIISTCFLILVPVRTFCVQNILSRLFKRVLFCSLHPFSCLTVVMCIVFFPTISTVCCFRCNTKYLQCCKDCLLKRGNLVNGLNDVSTRMFSTNGSIDIGPLACLQLLLLHCCQCDCSLE